MAQLTLTKGEQEMSPKEIEKVIQKLRTGWRQQRWDVSEDGSATVNV